VKTISNGFATSRGVLNLPPLSPLNIYPPSLLNLEAIRLFEANVAPRSERPPPQTRTSLRPSSSR
jgi:hypothetical protein